MLRYSEPVLPQAKEDDDEEQDDDQATQSDVHGYFSSP
jgi:hypothetical protein